MTVVVMVVSGTLIGFGAWMLINGLLGNDVIPHRTVRRSLTRVVGGTWSWKLTAGGVGLGVLVWWLSGWPAAGMAAGVPVVFYRRLVAHLVTRETYLTTAEAIAAWTESLRDILSGGAGLEQAIEQSARNAPQPIRAPLQRLRSKLEFVGLEEALVELADDIDHPSAGFVVAALVNSLQAKTGDLSDLLSRLAESTRDEVRMWARIDIERARSRSTALLVIGLSVTVIVVLAVGMRPMLGGYDTLLGQLVLLFIGAWVGFCGYMMIRMSRIEVPARFQIRTETLR